MISFLCLLVIIFRSLTFLIIVRVLRLRGWFSKNSWLFINAATFRWFFASVFIVNCPLLPLYSPIIFWLVQIQDKSLTEDENIYQTIGSYIKQQRSYGESSKKYKDKNTSNPGFAFFIRKFFFAKHWNFLNFLTTLYQDILKTSLQKNFQLGYFE